MSKPSTSGVEAVKTWREVKSRWDARDDATMRQTVVGWERWALRSGGRVPTLAVLDWTDGTQGRRIVSGVASV